MTFTKWQQGKPNEHKPGDDFGMYYADASGKRDPKQIAVDSWDDMGLPNSAKSYIIEFD